MRPFRSDRVLQFGWWGRMLRRAAVGGLLALTSAAGAQVAEFAPVAIDDSPVADRLLAEIEAQYLDNPERAAALLAELFDGYADRMVAVPGVPDGYRAARAAGLELLAGDAAVRSAWRERFDIEAEGLLERAGADETLRRRPFTAAGLEAALRVAQRCIESGSPNVGLRLLASIGSWEGASSRESGPRRDLLTALAWIAIERESPSPTAVRRRDEAIDVVRDWNAEVAERLEAWARIRSSGDPASIPMRLGELMEQEWTVLWEAPLEATLFLRRTTDRSTGRALRSDVDRARQEGHYLTSIPAIAGDLLVVNEGHLLEGIDRFTGRLRWYRDRGVGMIGGGSGFPADLNDVVIDGDDAYTVLGHAFSGGRGDDRSIVRFNPITGVECWSVEPDRMSGSPLLEDAQIAGPPLVLGELVMVPLRKTTGRLELIDLVLAIDRRDGTMRWIRTIASSASMRSSDPRPCARLSSIDGDVLVASAAGAIARLDGRTGAVVWLRRDEVPLRSTPRFAPAWQISGPVVLDSGIAVLDAARMHWVLLDPETGELLGRHPIGTGTVAGSVNCLEVAPGALDGRDLLLAIGTDVVAIDPDATEKALWSFSSLARSADVLSGDVGSQVVRGRVVVSPDGVLVPLVDGVVAIDPSTGRLDRLFDIEGPVNPVVAADAIHVVGNDAVATVMPVRDAVATLERRIRESGDAVPQAMALLDLAQRIGRPDLQLLAADAAVAGLDGPRGEGWRSEVLDLILRAVPTADDELGSALLDLAGAAASDDLRERVRHRLARAAWLEGRGRASEAVEEWLAIMGEGDSSGVLIAVGEDLDIAGGTVARARLRDARRKDPVLDRQLDEAALEEVKQAIESRATTSRLVDLARRWSGADAAGEAASRAIEILRDEADPVSAAAVGFVVARGFEHGDPRREDILEQAAITCEELARPDLASALRRAGAGSRTVARRPRIEGIPDHLEAIRGRLATITPDAAASAPPDLVLLFEPDTAELVARSSDGFQERWRRPVDEDHLVIEWGASILLWEGGSHRQPILSSIDGATGDVRWSTPNPTRLLPPPNRHAVHAEEFLPGGQEFHPWEIVPVPLAQGILLVRRDGAASFVDRADGQTVLWSRRDLMDRVYDIASGAGLVHLHGSSVDDRGEVVGRVSSFDPSTGVILLDEVIPGGEIRWAVADGLGRIAVGTTSEVRVLDPAGTRLGAGDRWIRRRIGLSDVAIEWISRGDLVVVDDEASMSAWALEDGRAIGDRWMLPDDLILPLGRPLGTLDFEQGRALHLDGRVVLHDREGGLLGMDALSVPGRRDWRLEPVEAGLLLVTRCSPGGGSRAVHRVQMLDPTAGLRMSTAPFELVDRPAYRDVRAVDGWLLFSTEAETHAMPMSASPESIPEIPVRP